MLNYDVKKQEFYKALIEKNSNYDGVFFVGVKTTGVFCHATCTAKKPKFENCNFFFFSRRSTIGRVQTL